MERGDKLDISSSGLHILAMGLMLCDHMWAMLFPAAEWMTCLGRMAFPIFAFLLVEGYVHTKNLRRYILRLLCGAVLSEIPFDLVYGDVLFYPFHQNVLWTFLLSLLLMALIQRCRERFNPVAGTALSVGLALALALAGFLLGYLTMVDYYGVGVLTVLVFYFFRGQDWKNRLLQFLCLFVLHVKVLGGYYYAFQLFGHEVEIVQQGFALLALIPIWLYRGRQGFHHKAFQYFCYAFYPAHLLALYFLCNWTLR